MHLNAHKVHRFWGWTDDHPDFRAWIETKNQQDTAYGLDHFGTEGSGVFCGDFVLFQHGQEALLQKASTHRKNVKPPRPQSASMVNKKKRTAKTRDDSSETECCWRFKSSLNGLLEIWTEDAYNIIQLVTVPPPIPVSMTPRHWNLPPATQPYWPGSPEHKGKRWRSPQLVNADLYWSTEFITIINNLQ